MAKSYTLRSIPLDVFRIVQKEQLEIRVRRGTNQFSFESTIYKMLKDYDRCRKDVKFKPDDAA